MRDGVLRFVAVFLCLWAIAPAAAQREVVGTDLSGRAVSLTSSGRDRVVVLFFVASDCPISNRLLPEMKRVEAQYAGRGVRFWFVYPNSTETRASIRAHLAGYGLGEVALTDVHGRLAHLTGAKVTPEAAVMVPDGTGLRTVYVGRIDDRYLSIGQERPQATRHDLEDAVAAAAAGRQPRPPGGPAVGCGMVSAK